MLNEGLRIDGWVEVILKDKDGKIKGIVSKDSNTSNDNANDIITDAGLAAILRLVFHNFTEERFGYIAIGTGTASESQTQRSLINEVKRKPANIAQLSTDITDDTVMLENVFSSEDGLSGMHEIAEIGIFNASIEGIMLARKVFSRMLVNWDAGDNLYIRYFIQMKRG